MHCSRGQARAEKKQEPSSAPSGTFSHPASLRYAGREKAIISNNCGCGLIKKQAQVAASQIRGSGATKKPHAAPVHFIPLAKA